MTLLLAREVAAHGIIWSSGSSRFINGEVESDMFLMRAVNAQANLQRDFPHRFGGMLQKLDERAYRRWVEKISVCDRESHYTWDSFIEVRKIIDEEFPDQQVLLFLVSSANHAPRVLRDAMKAFGGGQSSNVTLCAVSAETCYGGGTVEKIQVDDLGTRLVAR